MLKFIFFIIVFFLLVRFINRLFLPSNKQNKQFNPFTGGSRSGFKRSNKFEDIEEAEYEDLSNKDK